MVFGGRGVGQKCGLGGEGGTKVDWEDEDGV